MILIFVLLELLANWAYQWNFGTVTEILLHISLSCALFGLVTLLTGQKVRLAFALNTLLLFIFLIAYLISYQTEEALGVPLHLREAIENLQDDPSLLMFLKDFIYAAKGMILIGLIGIIVSLSILYKVVRALPMMTRKGSTLLALPCAILVTAFGIYEPKSLRLDPRLTFYFSWPTSVAPRGMERHLEMIDTRDEQARTSYNAKPNQTPNIVLIFADSLRADHFAEYGYSRQTAPFISSLSLAGKLKKVDWAFSTCSDSYCGIASTLSSRGRNDMSENPLKFNELLAKGGYENWALVAGDHKKFDDLGLLYGNSFDHFLDFETFPNFNKNDDSIIRAGLKQIPHAGDRPKFFYFFLMSSHVLGKKPAETQVFQPADVRKFVTKWHLTNLNERLSTLQVDRKSSLEAIVNNYDNGIRAADGEIRNIFETLSAKGYLEDALVFILGDHGDSLGEHNSLGHTYFLYNEDIHIPLYVYDTSGKPFQNTFYVTQEDIAPTILERVGLPIPEFYAGYSMYSKERECSQHQNEHRKTPSVAAIRKSDRTLYKYITFRDGKDSYEKVFDLTSDPDELNNIESSMPQELLHILRSDID